MEKTGVEGLKPSTYGHSSLRILVRSRYGLTRWVHADNLLLDGWRSLVEARKSDIKSRFGMQRVGGKGSYAP